MHKKINDKYSYDNFVWCCQAMWYAQYEDRLSIGYDCEMNHYFFKMVYPYHMELYTFDYCPFCSIDLHTFEIQFRQPDQESFNVESDIGYLRRLNWKLKEGLKKYTLDDFIWCCTKMHYVLGEYRLMVDYNPANNRYFFKMDYPHQTNAYSLNFCSWCAIDLQAYKTPLKRDEGEKRNSQYFKV